MFDFLANKFSSIFSYITGQGHLSEKNMGETLQKVRDALLEADVPYDVVQQFTAEITQEVEGQKVLKSLKPGEQFAALVHKKMVAFLGGNNNQEFTFQIPSIVMVMGLQGSGKTTTIAKLAYLAQKDAVKKGKARSILLASVDFYRPAALDQLETLARGLTIPFYRAMSADPVLAAQEIAAYAKKQRYEITFLDTAGRLHVDNRMLDELRQIDQLIVPKHKLLILDAMTGQESLRVAQAFDQAIGFEGAILTKMDSETRAGAAFAFKYQLKKPILFVTSGEKAEDIQEFNAERVAGRMLGMGDVQGLLERAQERISQAEQDAAQKNLMSGKFTLSDFAQQLAMIDRLGSFGQVLKYIPGAQTQKISEEQVEKAQHEMKRFGAIIKSMTPGERLNHKILNGSRKMRIAKGAGVTAAEVNRLMQRFEEMQQYAKLFKRMSKFGGF